MKYVRLLKASLVIGNSIPVLIALIYSIKKGEIPIEAGARVSRVP